tara:strand:+ start:204 stop:1511 length:1308 start_codon:yes stop_codon:yes gene_type:complete
MIKNYINRSLKKLASLQLAIGLLFLIGLVISLGTFIEQDQGLTFYKTNYSEANPVFGFLSWKVITFFGLDHLYTTWWFLLILFVFSSSLLSCTFTTQIPSIKTLKTWRFYKQPKQFMNLSVKRTLRLGFTNSFAYNCHLNKYHYFRQHKKGYAYSGLLGRAAPVVVHASIIVLIIGSSIGLFGGYIAQELIPRGEIVHIQNLTKFGSNSYIPQEISCRINDFWITYTKDQKTDQFYSDLSLINENGKELKRKTVFVNEPLTFQDIVLYQTDWDIVGLKIKLPNNEIFQLPLKKVTTGGRKFWLGSLTLNEETDQSYSVVKSNLTEKLSIYDQKGILVKESEIGEFFTLNPNIKIQFVEFITSTGLQIKSDPGISTVYLSFLLLMTSIYVSFFTYSQIWSVDTFKGTIIGGKSNRAVLAFQEELRKIFKLTIKTIS